MQRFTGRLIEQIKPDVVMLSGSNVHAFDGYVKRLAPNARTFRALHYAHRKGRKVEFNEAQKFREFVAAFSCR